MTCIVALRSGGKVFMGCDSAGVGGLSLQIRVDPKIYRVGPVLIGFTSSFRMGQLLGYSLKVPDHDPRMALEKYMATDFVNAVRTCLKEGGFARKKEEEESGGIFLVAIEGRLFEIESDYQVGERVEPFAACGCGVDLALGSLFTTDESIEPKRRLELALLAAEAFSAGVRKPFVFQEL